MSHWRIYQTNYFNAAPDGTLTNTITVPTALPTTDANVKLLLNMQTQDLSGDGGSGVYNIPDFIGTAQLSTAQKAYAGDGTSGSFDGNRDYITIPYSTYWDICKTVTETHTLDLWAYPTDTDNSWLVAHNYNAGTRFWGLLNYVTGGGAGVRLSINGTSVFSTNVQLPTNEWTHVVLVKIGGTPNATWALYQDGVQKAYATSSATIDVAGSAPLVIGNSSTSGTTYFGGYLGHPRIQASNIFNASPNVGLTDTITVPTDPYSVSSGVTIIPLRSLMGVGV
jgi:hypothetical protein